MNKERGQPREAAVYFPVTQNMVFVLGITAKGSVLKPHIHGEVEN